MYIVKSSLVIVFDSPFYKAIFERCSDSIYEVGQLNLGTSEPKITLIYALVTQHWSQINFFQQKISNSALSEKKVNPKRLQRLARKSVIPSVSTKAQRTLQKQLENRKATRKQEKSTTKISNQEKIFKLRQAKKIQKHKGH
ncbi:MAG: YjdF family protein [Liquorilactobacillus ghanensis]|uniref:YjdF family protein n=1 Tax=Liquorilactobacillus ghanensis TaxID=399370 RepID=UPI0039E7B759